MRLRLSCALLLAIIAACGDNIESGDNPDAGQTDAAADATPADAAPPAAPVTVRVGAVAITSFGFGSRLIGIFVHNIGSLFIHEITKVISEKADALGYDILVFNAERFEGADRVGTRDMLAKFCAGLILPMPSMDGESSTSTDSPDPARHRDRRRDRRAVEPNRRRIGILPDSSPRCRGYPTLGKRHRTGATHRAQHREKTGCKGFPCLGIAL